MSTRVAINGFGRVGRAAFRAAFESDADIEWVAVNDVADVDALAHVLARDSVYGAVPGADRGARRRDLRRRASSCRSSPSPIRPRCPGTSSASTSCSSAPAASGRAPTPRSISPPARAR